MWVQIVMHQTINCKKMKLIAPSFVNAKVYVKHERIS